MEGPGRRPGYPHQGAVVGGELREVPQLNPLAPGPAMTTVVQGVGDQARLPEMLSDVVVAAGVFTESMGEDDDTARFGVRRPSSKTTLTPRLRRTSPQCG